METNNFSMVNIHEKLMDLAKLSGVSFIDHEVEEKEMLGDLLEVHTYHYQFLNSEMDITIDSDYYMTVYFSSQDEDSFSLKDLLIHFKEEFVATKSEDEVLQQIDLLINEMKSSRLVSIIKNDDFSKIQNTVYGDYK